MSPDRLDIRILSILQNDSSLTNLELANRIGLSAPACLKRVKKLKQQGFIKKQVCLLEPEKFGASLHIMVEIEMERDRPDQYRSFVERALACKEIKQCYQVTGKIDFILIVTVEDIPTYEKFCRRVLDKEPNLRKFRSLICLHRHKFDTSLNIQ
ncbi:MAG: Lrp/AsnC family transcriptional regulator [Arenicella sp.]